MTENDVIIDGVRIAFVGQPIVDAATGETFQIEVLSRLSDAHLTPQAFFGALCPRGQLAILCAQIEAIAAMPAEAPHRFSLNVDPLLLEDANAMANLRAALSETPVAPALEITESRPLPEANMTNRAFFALKELGCLIELDDFGAGHAKNPRLISDYAFDVIKLDMNLLRRAKVSRRGAQVFEALVDLIRGLDKELIVEGVETEACQAFLTPRGATLHQGFLYARPAPLSAWSLS